ncbi:coiled-coil domain-containing protein 27 isoform X2 [Colius striatus]|uniref:coiled-coil domain-containing protein 27 isoform X2 n=1 Tax=Colius striatus TaxID=57412 RepID=UPI002B1E400F|nr:coiled-coil domain-containing protein 27 isoform X2 [Colius striatus]
MDGSPGAEPQLREALRKAREDYGTATGAIASLHRQLEIQESQLRRANSEKEMLQKKLREQENQLQALSAKFCSLREEWKHEELIVRTEQENCSLRQVVAEQESKLAEQSKLISELQGTVSQLQTEVLTSRHHIRKQQRAQEAMESHTETLQHKELQTRVALECLTCRKIINERTEFHQLLKQKGIKVPSLHSINTSTASSSTKGRKKSLTK